MSDRLASARRAIEARRARGGRALVPFLTAGYPDWTRFDGAVRTLAEGGADLLELGIPFSDPLADGPTIQASSQAALAAGVTVEKILDQVARHSSIWGLPLVLMSYANPILAYGADRFAREARAAGVAGLLVSDLPPEELPEAWSAFAAAGLERVVLVAPTTSAERLPFLAAAADGYVYCVTRTGVTGRGGDFATNFAEQTARLRALTSAPLVAGFGVRSSADARRLSGEVDGVVVGARMIELLTEGPEASRRSALLTFTRELRAALDADGK
jgi:tryptophan synthase alpha chain